MTPQEALSAGYKLVVPNQRLEQYWTRQALKSERVFHGRPVFSYRSLISFYFSRLAKSSFYRVLSDSQAIPWIAQVIFPDATTSDNISYIKMFYQGYQRLKRWKIPPEKMDYYFLNPSQKVFLKRILLLEKAKVAENILFQEDTAEAILQEPDSISADFRLYWVGFDDWTPLQQSIFDALSHILSENIIQQDSQSAIQKVWIKKHFLSFEEEIVAALDWLKAQPQHLRCAIIVPDLQNCYKFIRNSALAQIDSPLSRLPLGQASRHFGLSHGEPLSDQPIICDLLKALFNQGNTPSSVEEVKWEELFHPAEHLARLSIWMNWLMDLLNETGWLESCDLTSEEYQAGQAFWKECAVLKSLSSFYKPMGWTSFIEILHAMLGLTTFQAESLNSTHMIIGMLEASALPWDSIWLCHADLARFPQSLRKHPLIPDLLQQTYSFPHASFERETEYLNRILVRLFSQSKNHIISYAQHSDQGLTQPSFIIDSLASGPYDFQNSPVSFKRNTQAYASPIEIKKAGSLSLSHLDSFAQCPFQGWAKTLSQSQPEFASSPLFDPRFYGNFVHQNLQSFIQGHGMHSMLPPVWSEEVAKQERTRLQGLSSKIYQSLGEDLAKWDIEVPISIMIGQWRIRGRIDLYHPETKSVIDIKTRAISLSQWSAEEPSSWQGPVYALAVQAENVGLLCVANNTLTFAQKNIADHLATWRDNLEILIKKWEAGSYDPKPTNLQACRTCPYSSACRYHLISPDLHEAIL